MFKSLITGIFLLAGCIFTATASEKPIFNKETYSAEIKSNGMLLVLNAQKKLLEIPVMFFSNKGRQVWPPFKGFSPDIKICEEGKNTNIIVSFDKPGIVKKFKAKISLGTNMISIEVEAIPGRVFSNCYATISLYPEFFEGASYTGLNKNTPVSGNLPEGTSDKARFILNGLSHLSKITFFSKVGNVEFDFKSSTPWILSDFRPVKWSKKFRLLYQNLKFPANEIIKYTINIKIEKK